MQKLKNVVGDGRQDGRDSDDVPHAGGHVPALPQDCEN